MSTEVKVPFRMDDVLKAFDYFLHYVLLDTMLSVVNLPPAPIRLWATQPNSTS